MTLGHGHGGGGTICFYLFSISFLSCGSPRLSRITFWNYDGNDMHGAVLSLYGFDSLPFRPTSESPKFKKHKVRNKIQSCEADEGTNGNGCRGVAGARACEAVGERLRRLFGGA
jgi:hypothetical protein